MSSNSLQQQLNKMKTEARFSTFKTQDDGVLKPIDKIGKDGIDHINIWEKGSTDLGIALSHMADLPFSHETYGRFRSVEGFWHYIRSVTRDDRTRVMAGFKAKKFGDSLESHRVDNFKEIIMDANWQKINQYPPIVEFLKASTLPLDHYYLYNLDPNIRVRPYSAFWMIAGFEEIRKAIKEDRKPKFDFLKDRPSTKKTGLTKPHTTASLPYSITLIAKGEKKAMGISEDEHRNDNVSMGFFKNLNVPVETSDKKVNDSDTEKK